MSVFTEMANQIIERDATIASQAAEIERLTRCLKGANANHEHFEREWYLLGHRFDDQAAEIERLRHHLENMIEIAVEHMPENRPSIPHDYEPYDQYLADIAAARAALQPKEG